MIIDTSLLKPEMIAYAAGIIERGTFMMYHSPSTPKKVNYFQVNITVSLSTQEQSEWLEHFFKATIKNPYLSSDKKSINGYKGRWHGKVACHLAKITLPYLIAKRNHALLFTEYLKCGFQEGKYRALDEKTLNQRIILVDAVQKLHEEKRNAFNKNLHADNPHSFRISPNKFKTVYNNNIFDVFDGVFTEEKSRMAKSIFDGFLE